MPACTTSVRARGPRAAPAALRPPPRGSSTTTPATPALLRWNPAGRDHGSTRADLPSTTSQVRAQLVGSRQRLRSRNPGPLHGRRIPDRVLHERERSRARYNMMASARQYDACTVAEPCRATATFLRGRPVCPPRHRPAPGLLAGRPRPLRRPRSVVRHAGVTRTSSTTGSTTGVRDTFGWSFQLVSPAPHRATGSCSPGASVSGSPQSCAGRTAPCSTRAALPTYPANSDAINLPADARRGRDAGEPARACSLRIVAHREQRRRLPTAATGWCADRAVPPAALQRRRQRSERPARCPPSAIRASGGVIDCPCANPPAGRSVAATTAPPPAVRRSHGHWLGLARRATRSSSRRRVEPVHGLDHPRCRVSNPLFVGASVRPGRPLRGRLAPAPVTSRRHRAAA